MCSRLAGEPVELQNGDILEFGCMDGKKRDCRGTPEPPQRPHEERSLSPGICKDDNDLIKPGRITMKPTTEQHLAVSFGGWLWD